jgi:hypothetical protein
MSQKSIAQQIHELSQDGGLHDHSTGQQIRERLVKDFNVGFEGNEIVCPDASRLKEVKQWRVRPHDRDDSLTSVEAELKKYGHQVPVLVVSAPASKQEATVTLADGTTRKVWV